MLGACGSGPGPVEAGIDAAMPSDATVDGPIDGPIDAAGPGDAGDLAGDSMEDAGASHDGPPAVADLEGAWHTDLIVLAGGGSAGLRRRRFEGQTYYDVTSAESGYCAETGSFDLTAGSLTFTPQRVVGPGQCTLSAPGTETVAWTDSGIAFERAGVVTVFARTRGVRKIFATPETHDGNFGGDAALAGGTPIAKADAFCNASLGRPDGLPYKALLVDGVSRSAVPAIDWVFVPDTTYYRADGVLNLFYTNAAGLSNPTANNPAEPYGPGAFYQWTGLAFDFMVATNLDCQGWTSSSKSDDGGMADAASTDLFASSVSGVCNWPYGLLCVSL